MPVREPHDSHTSSELIQGLFRYLWAQPVLFALVEQPLRYRDLMVHLAASGRPVYPKTLASSLRYLHAQRLITHRRDAPRVAVYAITTHGRAITMLLASISWIDDRPHSNLDTTR
jgi:DNA-binding HxlR family transcriptional regulator